MPKKRRGILRQEIIIVDGKEIKVDTFDARVILGSGEELESIDELLKEEEVEKAIQEALTRMDLVAQKYTGKGRDVSYYYEVGKILQFVDTQGFTDRKGLIWRRLAYELRPDLFGGKRNSVKEAGRYPETMYHLGKQPQEAVKRATFDQWYEILKFRDIYSDKDLLEQILQLCEEGLSSIQLRQRIKELRVSKNESRKVG